MDFKKKFRLLAFYIPHTFNTHDIAMWVASNADSIINEFDADLRITVPRAGDTGGFSSKDLVFSRLVYLYYEVIMSNDQILDIMNNAKSHNVTLSFRDNAYIWSKSQK